jgi:hypothetical protein
MWWHYSLYPSLTVFLEMVILCFWWGMAALTAFVGAALTLGVTLGILCLMGKAK